MRLRCSGASQGDCIKTMARLLRRNKGGWQQNQKQTAQMQWRGHQAPTCLSAAIWVCIKTPARLLRFNGWAVKIQTSRSGLHQGEAWIASGSKTSEQQLEAGRCIPT